MAKMAAGLFGPSNEHKQDKLHQEWHRTHRPIVALATGASLDDL